MTERKPKVLAALEAKTRQFLLMVGFGFMALIAGSLFSATLTRRLEDRLVATDNALIVGLVPMGISRLWILLVFPVLVHLASRFLAIPLWRTAIIGALTGELFSEALQVVSVGTEEAFGNWFVNFLKLGTLVAGVLFAVWGGKRGQTWAAGRQRIADQAAIARKSQYDEFLAQSMAMAERREAAPIVPVAPAVTPEVPPKSE